MALEPWNYREPEKYSKYLREWRQRYKGWWMKRFGICQRCGSRERICLSHPSGVKVEYSFWSDERKNHMLKECIIRCRKCWSKEMWDKRGRAQHGSTAMYGKGCKCEDCLKARREADHKRRMNKSKVPYDHELAITAREGYAIKVPGPRVGWRTRRKTKPVLPGLSANGRQADLQSADGSSILPSPTTDL